MPKLELHNLKDTTHPRSKQIQFLENKVNRLRWLNDDLNKQVFNAVQRGHRLAAKLGYEDLNDAEAALATQAGGGAPQAHQSQLEQLSQHPSEELASHVQALQSELVSHIHLSKATLGALKDALTEMSVLREENEKLRAELGKARTERKSEEGTRKGGEKEVGPEEVPSSPSESTELAFVKVELAMLRDKYVALRAAKQESDDKHAKDYKQWKEFKQWLCNEEITKAERNIKRRKLNPSGEDDEDDEGTALKVEDKIRGKAYERVRKIMASCPGIRSVAPSRIPPLESTSPPTRPPVLASRNLNSSSSSPSSDVATPSKPGDVPFVPLQIARRNSTVIIPSIDMPGSSDTESDSQPVGFLYPSQLNVTDIPSTVPQKRPRSPLQDGDSSDTEAESQAVTFLFPSQMIPLTPAQVSGMTVKPSQDVRRAQHPLTPVSVVRPQAGKPRGKPSAAAGMLPPPSSPSTRDPFRPSLRSVSDGKPRVPETPMSRPMKKGKERTTENDENTPASTNAIASTKGPGDYSIYKGRGRYGPQAQAAKETINALFEIDPGRNGGVGFQFEEVVRDKEKRKGMHGGDCECCRDYYNAVGPLPTRLQPPMWRSPESSPSKKPVRISFGDGGDDENENAAIEQHKNAISRHRQQWERAKTPPGYWNIGFPDTQEVAAMNAEAARMHDRKRAMVAEEVERGGKYRKRSA